jgi:hypothetical protein
MCWINNPKILQKSQRIIRRFLWFPTSLVQEEQKWWDRDTIKETRWLEYACIYQVYSGKWWFDRTWVNDIWKHVSLPYMLGIKE